MSDVRGLGPVADKTGIRAAAAMGAAGAPLAVKRAAAEQVAEWTDLPAVCYADAARTYPVHKAAAVVVSAATYAAGGDTDLDVLHRIKSAARTFGVRDQVDQTMKLAKQAPATSPVRYADQENKKYPLDTPAQVKSAAAYIEQHATVLGATRTQKMACAVLEAGRQLLPGETVAQLEKQAGFGIPLSIDRVFQPRKSAAMNGGHKEIFDALHQLEKIARNGGVGTSARVVTVLRQIDKRAGWSFADPAEDLTGGTPSMAAKAAGEHVVAPSGAWYRKDDLAKIPSSKLNDAYGVGPIVPVAKRAEMLQEYGTAFESFLDSHDVKPVRAAPRKRPTLESTAKGV